MPHLFVLCHGVGGSTSDMEYFARCLRKGCVDANGLEILTYVPHSNSAWGCTLDGVDTGGERLVAELGPILSEPTRFWHSQKHPLLKRTSDTHKDVAHAHETTHGTTQQLSQSEEPFVLSVVGHSCGGIYMRYALGRLAQAGLLSSVWKLRHFVTLASPHLGVQTVWGPIAARLAFGTVRHLCLGDSGSSEGEASCLLVQLTSGVFLDVLKRFEHRWAVADRFYDVRVAWVSASIQPPHAICPDGSVPKDETRILAISQTLPLLATPNENGMDKKSSDSDPHCRMTHALLQTPWWRIDVAFRPVIAHEDMIVRDPSLNSIGRPFVNWLSRVLCISDEYINQEVGKYTE